MARPKDLQLELFASDINESQWDDEFVYCLDIPVQWKVFIQNFRKNKYQLSRKLRPLGMKLQSIFADLIWINNAFHIDDSSPWIIASKPIESRFIHVLAHYWFTQLAEKEGFEPPSTVQVEKLIWRKRCVSEVRDDNTRFSLIPAIIANQFCQSSKTLVDQTDKSHELQFTKVCTSNQVECMSQPITRDAGSYSYVIGFRLQTRGGQPNRPLLLITCGIRRFITKPVETKYLKGKINSSILVSLAHPFLKQHGMKSYAKLSFRRTRKGKNSYTRWSEGMDELFWDVLYGKTFSPEELLTNPADFWNNNKMQAMIIHNNQLFQSHPIGPGASKGEKNRLYDLVKEELQQLTSLKPLPFIKDPLSKRRKKGDPVLPLFHSPTRYQHIKLEIWGQTDLYAAVLELLQNKLVKEKPISFEYNGNVFKINADQNLLLEVIHCEEPFFTDSLETGNSAFEHRANSIFNSLGKTNEIVISLIEIPPKSTWEPEEDPKDAIREGFRRSRRLTQFIHPLGEDEKNRWGNIVEGSAEKERSFRVERSILDLFSDLGFMDMDFYNKLPKNRPICAYDVWKADMMYPEWNKKMTVFYPFMTKLYEGDLLMKGLGVDQWLPIRDVILNCTDYHYLKSSYDSSKASHWLNEQLMREVLDNLDPLLLVDTRLRYSWLKCITNTKISVDQNPEFSEWTPSDKRLNVIRINTTEDVPSYRFYPEKIADSFSTGVFYDEAGMYYGIGSKPLAMRKISKAKTKYEFPEKAFLQPQAVEFMPLGFTDIEERHKSAWIVQHLRELAVSYDLTTVMPYPLKMMKSVQKYLNRADLASEWTVDPEVLEW